MTLLLFVLHLKHMAFQSAFVHKTSTWAVRNDGRLILPVAYYVFSQPIMPIKSACESVKMACILLSKYKISVEHVMGLIFNDNFHRSLTIFIYSTNYFPVTHGSPEGPVTRHGMNITDLPLYD